MSGIAARYNCLRQQRKLLAIFNAFFNLYELSFEYVCAANHQTEMNLYEDMYEPVKKNKKGA